jgi:hypothetical protein
MKPRLFCMPMLLRMHAAALPAPWSTAIRDQVPNVIGYLPGKLCNPATVQCENFYMHFTMLEFAHNMISCISVRTYFYVYLAGDLTWTMLLGESDSILTSWLPQQSPMTTSTSRERLTTQCRLQRLLVGFNFDRWVHQQPSATT